MTWRALLESHFEDAPEDVRNRRMAAVAEENDYAERHGFICILDNRRPTGCCYFAMNEDIQNEKARVYVWLGPDGWCRSRVLKGSGGRRGDTQVYHTQSQAILNDGDFFKLYDCYGEQQ